MTKVLRLGYIPLVDAAPLIAAREFGFAEEEGVQFDLVKASSWSMLRDLLDFATVDAAHMLSVMPIARALGLGSGSQPLDALMVLSLNGQVFGLSPSIPPVPFGDPVAAGEALAGLPDVLRIGVPFPFSMQAELLSYWIERAARGARVEIRTVPPSRMAETMLAGEIDGFCVGEPWGSHAVEQAGARLVLPGASIWSQAPEKVLAVRHGWADERRATAGRMMRAIWRAARWIEDPANRLTLAEVLSRPDYLDVSAELVERSLSQTLLITALGPEVQVSQFQTFHHGAANFPWRSQAAWIGDRLSTRFGLNHAWAIARARDVFRSDLYRENIGPLGAALPRNSEKAEGVLEGEESLPATSGSLILARNRFFDGEIFDPIFAEG
ncbi:CmpA/NrtA family ABC transporter substrate-binding protein [Thioclava sp. FR2]|uniref:CmpA/NrtA family ABC transporter substrate-binding protein n=1 Tax=Thioclava sp. FR2 TaxID=3445780 RepID=UPI003EBB80E0